MISPGDTLIFDLDGTLVDSSAFEDHCFIGALREVLGDVAVDGDWSRFRHVTDAGISGQLVAGLGEAAPARAVARIREAFGRRVGDYLAGGGACREIPGARYTLNRLLEGGYRVGIATGGWGHTARMKLAGAGFETAALTLSSSDDAVDRAGIMRHCLQGLGGDGREIVYFGDGPWDITATASLGWRFIGVGARLAGLCQHWIADYLDPRWPLAPATTGGRPTGAGRGSGIT